jgi:hypothetical protein
MIAFPQMILDGSLKNIKQLIVEFHITTRPEPNKLQNTFLLAKLIFTKDTS